MKLLSTLLVFSLGLSAFARHDGDFMRLVTRENPTPHLSWAQDIPSASLRVFFVSNGQNARALAELAQRMNIDYTEFIGNMGSTDVYNGAMTGTSPAERSKELSDKLLKDYDVVVFYNQQFSVLPSKERYFILEQVQKGKLNLVLFGDWSLDQYKKVLKDKLPDLPVFANQFSEPIAIPKDAKEELKKEIATENSLGSKSVFSCYKFGEGRIVKLKLGNPEFGCEWKAAFENRMALFMQAMLWAGKTELPAYFSSEKLAGNPVFNGSNNDVSFYLTGKELSNVSIEVRIRNLYDGVEKVLNCSAKDGFKVTIPQLASGKYYADVFVKKGGSLANFGFYNFSVDSGVGKISIALSSDSIEKGDVPKGQIRIGKPAKDEMTMRLSMFDSPYGRLWAIKEIKVPANTDKIDFKFDNFYNPTIAGTLFAEFVNDKGEILDRSTKTLYFPNREIEDYFIYGWGANADPFASAQLEELFGFKAGLNGRLPATFLMNQRPIPYSTHISIGVHPKTGATTDIGWGNVAKYDDCIYNPEVRKKVAEQIKEFMEKGNYKKYGVPIYSLGDENTLNFAAGFGPEDAKYFREYLSKKYKDIASLNREWKTSYPDFNAVPNEKSDVTRKAGNYPAWNDHYEFIEQMYADWHAFWADEIKKYDRYAKVGAEGSSAGDIERTIEKLEFWGPYRSLIDSEAMRAFAGNKIRTIWYGYHGERGEGKSPVVMLDMLNGVINGLGWFQIDDCSSSMCIIGADHRPSFPSYFNGLLNQMRFGLGQILVSTPLEKPNIAVYWSHLSDRASAIDKRCVSPADSTAILLRFFYRNGINFDMVSDRTLERLKNKDIKIFFMDGASVVSDKAAEAIKNFVKDGGTVVADMNPGLMNGYMRQMEKNQLSELFGDQTFDKLKVPAIRKLDLDKELNGVKIKLDSAKANCNPDSEFFIVRDYGKGKAILLNFTLPIAEVTASQQTPFDDFLGNILLSAGAPMKYKVEIPAEGAIVRVRQGNGFELIGAHVGDKSVAEDAKGSIKIPSVKYIYKCKSGFLGKSDTIELDFNKHLSFWDRLSGKKAMPLDKSPLQLYALFDTEQFPPDFTVEKTVKLGGAVEFDFSKVPADRTLLIQVFSPDGKEMLKRNLVLNTAKIQKCPFHFAFNEMPGNYKFSVMDVATGLSKDLMISAD
ncbi:MAG: hypothetical protein A2X49_07530 [Lentisphaerae bacterium GWF2_52_8]|nr:MAG: hypothetical protein A2X49_07530 [Lentisphaerae bacterium GWF2_52_8]